VELGEQKHQPERGERWNQEQQANGPLPAEYDDGTNLGLVDGSVEGVDSGLFIPVRCRQYVGQDGL
jgi:hypothetical protein